LFAPVQAIVNFPSLFPGRIVRGPSNQIISIDNRAVNLGGVEAEGFDIHVAYVFETGLGALTPSVDWTIITKFETSLVPGVAPVDRLSRADSADAWAPRHKGTAALAWKSDDVSARIAGRYVGRYLDYQTPPNDNHLGDFWLVDANVRVDLDDILGIDDDRNLFLSASVTNLFDREPDYSNFTSGLIGYDPTQYDLLGRIVRIGIGVSF
jgi:iron complex outermembrane receptor protein